MKERKKTARNSVARAECPLMGLTGLCASPSNYLLMNGSSNDIVESEQRRFFSASFLFHLINPFKLKLLAQVMLIQSLLCAYFRFFCSFLFHLNSQVRISTNSQVGLIPQLLFSFVSCDCSVSLLNLTNNNRAEEVWAEYRRKNRFSIRHSSLQTSISSSRYGNG